MADVRPTQEVPPGADTELHSMARLDEHHRAGIEHLGQGARVVFRSRRNFGEGHVTSLLEEVSEAGVRDGVPIHPKSIDRHAVDGRFLCIVLLRTHAERSAGNPDHAGKRRLARGGKTRRFRLQNVEFKHVAPFLLLSYEIRSLRTEGCSAGPNSPAS
jgi:hypothetical protein